MAADRDIGRQVSGGGVFAFVLESAVIWIVDLRLRELGGNFGDNLGKSCQVIVHGWLIQSGEAKYKAPGGVTVDKTGR